MFFKMLKDDLMEEGYLFKEGMNERRTGKFSFDNEWNIFEVRNNGTKIAEVTIPAVGIKVERKEYRESFQIYYHYEADKICLGTIRNLFDIETMKWLIECRTDINQLLLLAIFRGNVDAIKYLLDAGADIHTYDITYLEHAVKSGSLDVVKLLQEKGLSFSKTGIEYQCLSTAASHNYLDIFEHLLKDAEEVFMLNGSSILYTAVQEGSLDVVKFILKHGVDISESVLELVVKMARKEIVECFIETLAVDCSKYSLALQLAKQAGCFHAVSMIIDLQIDRKEKNEIILCNSAEYGYRDGIVKIAGNGTDIHVLHEYPLCLAAENGHLDVVECLIKLNADVHARNDYPIQHAAKNGHLDMVKYLVSMGANIHANNSLALRFAAKNGYLDIVKYLFEIGANIHAEGEYALRMATENGHFQVVKFILDHGAATDIKKSYFLELNERILRECLNGNDERVSYYDWALKIASQKGYLDIAKYAIEAGADIHKNDDEALYFAAVRGYLDIVKLLVSAGANIHAQNDHLLTSAAYSEKSSNVVRYLVGLEMSVCDMSDSYLMNFARYGFKELKKKFPDRCKNKSVKSKKKKN